MNRLPEELVVKLTDLLRDHYATALYGVTLGLLGDQIEATTRDAGIPAMVDTNTVRQLIRAYNKQGHLAVLAPVLELVEPYLPVLQRSEPILVEVPPVNLTAIPGEPKAAALVSSQEIKVLVGIANGMSNGDIGKAMFLSENTVKSHAHKLFRKLGARDRAHAVRRGYETGILQLRSPSDQAAAS